MLILQASRDDLLKPLQTVTGIVERRHTLPILSNVLIEAQAGHTKLLATDLEIQIHTTGPETSTEDFASPPAPKSCKTFCVRCLSLRL